MMTSQHSNLFRTAGPGAALDYLMTRLDDLDLAQDEALAMISAVHRELGRSRSDERGVYASYSRFMQALNRQMPVVHDFVIAKWSESRYADRRQPRNPEDEIDETAAEAESSISPSAGKPVQQGQAVHPDAAEGHAEGERSEEPGEPDEEEQPEARGEEAASTREARAEAREEDDETADAELDEPEDRVKEEPEEAEDSEEVAESQEEGQETEDLAEGAEAQEEAQEAEPLEAEQDEQAEAEGEESDGEERSEEEGESEEGEAPEPEGIEAEKGDEEGQWPAGEQLEAPEPLDGEEGGEAAAE